MSSVEKVTINTLLISGQENLYNELYDQAVVNYSEILTINNQHIEGLYGLARSYLLQNEFLKSAEVILTLTAVDKEKSYTLKHTYADLLFEGGKKTESIEYLSSLYKSNPYDKKLALSLIDKYLAGDAFDKAYQTALELYTYHYSDKGVLKKIAEIASLGNLVEKESWLLLAQ